MTSINQEVHTLAHMVELSVIGGLLKPHKATRIIELEPGDYKMGEQVFTLCFTRNGKKEPEAITFTETEFRKVKEEIKRIQHKF